MSERDDDSQGGMWVIVLLGLLLGAFLGLSIAINFTDHVELRDLQRRVGQLEESVKR